MYVCSYAVKADKNPLLNIQSLRRLKHLEDVTEDRKRLGAIARNSTSVRVIGAQEAVDFLLDNPLTFCSADVQDVHTSALMRHALALTEEQASNIQDSIDLGKGKDVTKYFTTTGLRWGSSSAFCLGGEGDEIISFS